jgi:hypothetical protein
MFYRFKQNFIIVLILATFSFLISCGDDQETPRNLIEGTWNFSDLDFEGTINGKPINVFLTEDLGMGPVEAQAAEAFIIASITQEIGLDNSTVEFNSVGNYIIRENGVQQEQGTYVLQNANTQLLLTSDEGTQEFLVKELTANRLVISATGEELEDIDEDGELDSVEFTMDITLTK